jgi:hypothetical protein
MATLARRLFKFVLFIGLFCLSVRYVHTYPVPMPANQLHVLWVASDWLGIRDPDDLYIPAMLVCDLIVTVLAYIAIVKLWRYYRTKRRCNTVPG